MVAWGAFISTLQQNKADENDGNNKQRTLRDFPGDPVAKIQCFHSRGAHVPSPAGELRSRVPSAEQTKKKKTTIKQNFKNALKILVPKNWCLQIVALEKTLENLLDCKENKPARKSTLNIPSKDWWWSSNTLATWWGEPTYWKRPWCWERLRVREEGGRGWDG